MRTSVFARLLVVVATAVMSVAVAPFMSSAAQAASLLDDVSVWTGTGGISCAQQGPCSISAASTTCQEITTDGPIQIIRTGCSATLSGNVSGTVVSTCDGVATGNYFHFSSAGQVPSQAWTTVLTFADNAVHFEAFAVNATGNVVGRASGDLAGGCTNSEATFAGVESLAG